jgi:hypothetical protein
VYTPKRTTKIDCARRGSNHDNRTCLILTIGLLLLVAATFFPSLMTGTFQIYDDTIFKAKDGDAVVRPSPVHKESLRQLQILQQRLDLTDGHIMARIQTVVDEGTEAVLFENAALQQENENDSFEHMVNRTEWRDLTA